jgi:hypothetical protein
MYSFVYLNLRPETENEKKNYGWYIIILDYLF